MLTEYKPLEDALKIPLPERADQREELRRMIAFAESYGVVVSQHRRTLLADYENERAMAVKRLRDGVVYNEKAELEISEEAAELYKKMNADEKEIMLKAEVSVLSAELDYVTTLEELIKRRCSVGQSISNSLNVETSTKYNN